MIGSTLKQHVFTGGDPSPFTLYVPTMISVYCDSGYLGQTLWGVGTYTVAGLYPGCFQVVLGYTISGSFYAGLSPTYFRCMPCPPGSYSVSGSSACTPCPVGTSQPGTGSTACIACDEGYVASSPGTAACVTCDGGYYEPGNRSLCVPCLPGAYASAGSTVCQDCPENTFSSGGRETCAPCPYFSRSSHVPRGYLSPTSRIPHTYLSTTVPEFHRALQPSWHNARRLRSRRNGG